jgi:hypothetical protein
MCLSQLSRLTNLVATLFAPRWTGSVASWVESDVRFDEPKLSGPFSFAGREYLREMLDSWSDDSVTDMVGCMGTRTGKTRVVFGGLGWKIKHSPTRALWVMPNTEGTGGAKNVSRTRFQPMIKTTPCLAELIPTKGQSRHSFKTLQMIINGSIIDLTGSNSPANLSGNPCDTVVQDECDKYKRLGQTEADPSKLADQRCKEFSTPKRIKFSTPTLVSGIVWQELMKSDMRRRFLPCPHCNPKASLHLPKQGAGVFPTAANARGWVVFAWSAQYTVLNKTGCEAYVRWDPAAKQANGEWDMLQVEATAHAACPHCKGKILDTHKVWMDKHGEWRATQKGSPRYRGWHLPSMYSVASETTFGRMAVRFLNAKQSVTGLQDFINSDLAEPYQAQDSLGDRVETITSQLEITADWTKLLTIDSQAVGSERAGHFNFWAVARAWNGGNSEGLEAMGLDTWDDIEQMQKRHGIKNAGVMIDSGWGSKSDADVYANCASHCDFKPRAVGLPIGVGWMPAKGMPKDRRWRDEQTKLYLPYTLKPVDPFIGTDKQGIVSLDLFEFASDFYKDILANLRRGQGGFRWAVAEKMASEEYWRHLDGQHKIAVQNRFDGRITMKWEKRHRYWPDHLFSCEVMSVAKASFHGLLLIEKVNLKKNDH